MGNMFGNHIRSLDEKNRVAIPSKLRTNLGQVCYVTVGNDRVLELRDENSFKDFQTKLQSANALDQDVRNYARMILGSTVEAEIDKQGRIMLPNDLLNYASLTKEVVFVGIGNKTEIWSKEKFDKFQNQFKNEESITDLAKKLFDKGVSF